MLNRIPLPSIRYLQPVSPSSAFSSTAIYFPKIHSYSYKKLAIRKEYWRVRKNQGTSVLLRKTKFCKIQEYYCPVGLELKTQGIKIYFSHLKRASERKRSQLMEKLKHYKGQPTHKCVLNNQTTKLVLFC